MSVSMQEILYDGAGASKRNWKIAFEVEDWLTKKLKTHENYFQNNENCTNRERDANHRKDQTGVTTDENKQKANAVNSIFHQMINEYIGKPFTFNHKRIMELKKYIWSIVKNQKQIEKLMKDRKDPPELSGAELGRFLHPVLKKILTKELLGCQENCGLMMNRFCKALKSGKKDQISAQLFIRGLNLKSIKWIKKIKSEEDKALIIAKIIKWLFKFILKLLKYEFYVSECQGFFHKLTFIHKSEWKRREDKVFNDLILDETIEKVHSNSEEIVSKRNPARIRFIPKKVGLRPIISVKDDKKDDVAARIVFVSKTFVKQLLQKNHNFTVTNPDRLCRLWTGVCKKHRAKSKLHLVTLDINNAYGSILQDRLMSILLKEVEKAVGPNKDHFHFDKVKEAKGESRWVFKEYFKELYRGAYKGPIMKTEKFSKAVLLQHLENVIKHQTIKKKSNLFLIKRGISQGISVSTALCNLYLAHFCDEELKDFSGNEEDCLIRAVDDFLYITPSETRAREFMSKMHAGFEDYNITINRTKTKSTLVKGQTKIPFFGFVFDSETFQVTIKPVSARNAPFRNMIIINHMEPAASFLELKMKQVPAQKLNRLTLSKDYMTDQGAAENVFTTSCLMASIFKAILSMLFVTLETKTLVGIIRRTALFLASKVMKLRGEIVQTVVKAKFVRWMIFQAFILCLQTQPLKEYEDIVPKLVKLQDEEKVSPHWIENVGGKLFNTLPAEFYLGG